MTFLVLVIRTLHLQNTLVAIHEGVKYWHGATKDSWFSHIAITKGTSEWCEEVDDATYSRLSD